MDRLDEKEKQDKVEESRPDPAVEVGTERDSSTEREGDVLGLSGITVPKMPGDLSASNDPEEVRQRRTRAMGPESDPQVEREDPYQQGKGATGIDMGAGGSGTDIKPS